MSATIGTRAARTICFNAAVLSASGQETRTMSAPASSQRRIWSIVAFTSGVGVLVMVCTVTGASPPTGTLPTMICRDLRRSMSLQGLTDMRAHIGAPAFQRKSKTCADSVERSVDRGRRRGEPARALRGHVEAILEPDPELAGNVDPRLI